MKDVRVLVTGGAGLIGSYVVEDLLSRNASVLVVDNLSSGSIHHVSPALLVVADLTAQLAHYHLDVELEKFQPTHVIDLAASPYIPDSYASFDWSMGILQSNMNIAANVAKLVLPLLKGIERYVYVSTSEVYGTAVSEDAMDEGHRLHPQSTYATSKLACERFLLNWHHEHEIPVTVVRQFNCYGPRSTHPYVIPEIISQLSKGGELKLGNTMAERDFSFVKDAAKRLVEVLLSKNVKGGEVYNSGEGRCWSIQWLADKIAELMGQELPNITVEDERLRPHDVNRLLCDNRKLKGTIGGWKPTPIEKGLLETIEYYENQGRWLWEK